MYSGNVHLLNAALAAGLYPKLLSVDPYNGALKTVSNNQAVSFHPSSINFGKRATEFGVNYLCYFTLMSVFSMAVVQIESVLMRDDNRQSKKLYAWETGPVDDLAMVLMCGEPEFKVLICCDLIYNSFITPFTSSLRTWCISTGRSSSACHLRLGSLSSCSGRSSVRCCQRRCAPSPCRKHKFSGTSWR